MAKPQYWLIKSEPSVYAYAQLEKDGRTEWTGVRNFEARNNIRAMKPGDLCLYYHSNEDKAVVGVAQVLTPPGPDSTVPDEDWAATFMGPVVPFTQPVDLATIKATAALKDFPLVTRGRLSVAPVTATHFKQVLKMGKTVLPK
ncbi:ubiquinol-cytochrome C reductase [Myxococcus xanthus]|uniref:EVE domain-containing protein n=1 Tax=Myxococcus TaxID=32 RepID=UPI001129235A|nr:MULTISPECIES: EVE domain-containing protein [Myxococcus]QDE90110.1 ubiquinol-cytochrome C reductase [Myxococcus xanthus]QQR47456.1 EVE domain-containing protein [Myxococcus xanthus]WNZ65230.1 EVE domain-containing protein [Myxococcus sp. MxC21-1]